LATFHSPSNTEQAAAVSFGRTFLAGRFVAAADWDVTRIDLFLRRLGTSDGPVRCRTWLNNSGIPGSALVTSAAVFWSVLPVALDWVAFSFTTPLDLASGQITWAGVDLSASPAQVVMGERSGQSSSTFFSADGSSWAMLGSAGIAPLFRVWGFA
jgi:hypothetical protein